MSLHQTRGISRTWRVLAIFLALSFPVFATGGGGNGGISILPQSHSSMAISATHHVQNCWEHGILAELPEQESIATTALVLPGMAAPAAVFASTSAIVLSGLELKTFYLAGVTELELHVVSGAMTFRIDLEMDSEGGCEVRIH